MNKLQFFGWCVACIYIFTLPFSILNMSFPWSKNKKVLIYEKEYSLIPPYSTEIHPDKKTIFTPETFSEKVSYNIRRSVRDNDGQWSVEYWKADNLKLLRWKIIPKDKK